MAAGSLRGPRLMEKMEVSRRTCPGHSTLLLTYRWHCVLSESLRNLLSPLSLSGTSH